MNRSVAPPLSLGVSFHTLDPDQTLPTLALLRHTPVKALEIWEPTFSREPEFVESFRIRTCELQIDIRTVHAPFSPALDPSSPDPAIQRTTLEAFSKTLTLARQLNAFGVIVHPSSEPIGDAERSLRFDTAKKTITQMARQAGEVGCRILVEWLPRTCQGRTEEELIGLVDDLPPQTAGVCLDTNHLMNRYENLPHPVHRLHPRMLALHCSDYDGRDEQHALPGRGVISWPRFIQSLRDIGFPGPFHYEVRLEEATPQDRISTLVSNYHLLFGI